MPLNIENFFDLEADEAGAPPLKEDVLPFGLPNGRRGGPVALAR